MMKKIKRATAFLLSLALIISAALLTAFATSDDLTHKVQAGETLLTISRIYGPSWKDIADANSIQDASDLKVGTDLTIPQDIITTKTPGDAYAAPADSSYTETVLFVPSTKRPTSIPATVIIPNGETPQGGWPAVVLNHGHGAGRDSLALVAQALGAAGIASIRMSFAGSAGAGPWVDNSLTSMMDDSNDCAQYLITEYDVNAKKLGIIGHSMGGRVSITLLGTEENEMGYTAAVMFAPHVGDGKFWGMMNGYENNALALDYAEETGYWPHLIAAVPIAPGMVYKAYFNYTPEFFRTVDNSPCEDIGSFNGNMLVIFGGQDANVPPATNRLLIDSVNEGSGTAKGIYIASAGHDLGLGNEVPAVTKIAIESAVEFFLSEFGMGA